MFQRVLPDHFRLLLLRWPWRRWGTAITIPHQSQATLLSPFWPLSVPLGGGWFKDDSVMSSDMSNRQTSIMLRWELKHRHLVSGGCLVSLHVSKHKQTFSICSLKRDSAPQYTHAHTCVQLCTHVYTHAAEGVLDTHRLFWQWVGFDPFFCSKVLFLALPVGIIGNEFTSCWQQRTRVPCWELLVQGLVTMEPGELEKAHGIKRLGMLRHRHLPFFSGRITRTNVPSTSHIHMILCWAFLENSWGALM